jgi:alkylation response protein AidB-like acyl-CoA dehydrogenase
LLDELGRNEFAPKAARWDEHYEYPWENIHKLNEFGILGMTIPKGYGGQECSLIDAVMASETTAKYCGVTARIIVETNIGALGCIITGLLHECGDRPEFVDAVRRLGRA